MGTMDFTLATPRSGMVAPRCDEAIVTLQSPARRYWAPTSGPIAPTLAGDDEGGTQALRICLAHDERQACDAQFFVEQRYREMGYFCSPAPAARQRPVSATLLAYLGTRLVGTLTLGFDVGLGLVADDQYHCEVDALRGRGGTVAEITKLALDTRISSKRLLAAIFNVGYLYLRKVWRCTDLVIEVTPAHAAFYVRSLQFCRLGAPRICPRVNVEGVLLWLDLLATQRTVAELAGKADPARPNRNLYSYFFAAAQEARVTERLLQVEPGSNQR